jgi:hypothetical protein
VLGIVIALGLASRKFESSLAPVLAENAGDALWTGAIFISLAFCRPQTHPIILGLVAFGISIAVELSQLADAHWLNEIRKTLPGRLLLGAGFLWVDLIRYLAGASLVTAVDWAWIRKASKR